MQTNMTRRDHWESRRQAVELSRATWIAHYKQISDNLLPRRGRYLGPNDSNRGTSRNAAIIDETATLDLGILAAGMKAGLANKARRWFTLGTPDTDLMEWGPVKNWLHDAEKLLYAIFAASNFYSTLTSIFEEMGAFGTALMLIDQDPQTIIHCHPFTAGSYSLALSGKNEIDTFYREEVLTVSQLIDRFGESKVKEEYVGAWKEGSTEMRVPIIHLVEPNDDRIEGYQDAPNMPYRSVYYDPNDDEGRLLRKSGYEEMPFVAPRWWVTATDTYGTSPGMVALGSIKELFKDTKRKGKAIERIVNPTMVADVALKTQRVSTIPGDVTYVDSQTANKRFEPAWIQDSNITPQLENIMDIRNRIDDAFFKKVFQMLSASRNPQMTAREVEELHEEKMVLLGPVVEHAEDGLLAPAIHRTLNIAERLELMAPMPDELREGAIEPEFISILSVAQRAAGIGGIEQTVGFFGALAEMNPEVLDKLDFDQAVDEYARMRAVPPRMIRTDEDVKSMRDKRKQQQQQQAMMEQAANAQKLTQGIKDLSETQMAGGNSVLDQLSGAAPPQGVPQ